MKSGLKSRGFTIVEVLIFLAVSSALMVSAFTLISGSQNKAAFTQGINDVQQQIDTVINNVSNGYYAEGSAPKTCTVDATGVLSFSGSGAAKGTSSTCIFLGRVIVFQDGIDTFTVYNIAGKRQANGRDVTSIADANPTIIPDTQQVFSLKNGITFKSSGGINAFGFFNGLGTPSGTSDQLTSGYQQATFYGFQFDRTDLPSDFGLQNPAGGFSLCFDSGTTQQSGVITIGGNNRAATSSLEVKGTKCP
jgi:type II secretory pathway pseudopilin PulG